MNLNHTLKNVKNVDDTEEVEIQNEFKLKKELGLLYSVAVITCLIIGGGIYISPQIVLKHSGSPGLTIIMWFLGGIMALVGAMCFAEIGVKLPRSGAFYAYLMELYGPYFGFLYLWQFILLIRSGSNSLKTTLLATFLLKPFFPYCPIPTLAMKLLASFVAIGVCVLNGFSVKLVAKTQTAMTLISVSTLVCISAVGIYAVGIGSAENLEKPFADSNTDPGSLILALYNTAFSYGGWSALNYIIEEVKHPKRTLPLAILISMALVICLYTLVNLSYILVLTTEEMLTSEAVAISMAMKIWPPIAWVFSICIAFTAGASLNSGILVGSRLTYVGARNGQVPEVVSYINIKRITPMISLAIQCFMCVIFIWFSTIELIIQNLIFCHVLMEMLIIVAFIKLRIRERHSAKNPKNLELPLVFHLFYFIVLFILFAISLIAKPYESCGVFVVILLASTVLYLIFIKYRSFFIKSNALLGKVYRYIQIIFESAPEEKCF